MDTQLELEYRHHDVASLGLSVGVWNTDNELSDIVWGEQPKRLAASDHSTLRGTEPEERGDASVCRFAYFFDTFLVVLRLINRWYEEI